MFSKISDQVYNIMGATKAEVQEAKSTVSIDDVELNKTDPQISANDDTEKLDASELLTKVKTQFDTWIDKGISQFKKLSDSESASPQSSSTLKSLENLFQTTFSKAEKTFNETTDKIKKSIEDKNFFSYFSEFQSEPKTSTLPPWAGNPNEKSLKAECLNLSSDRRNFTRKPPIGVEFDFNYDTSYKTAMAIMEEDPNLVKMRFQLVPKVINEETFWKNYFYRISLIFQANELENMIQKEDHSLGTSEKFLSDSFQTDASDLTTVQNHFTLSTPREEEWKEEIERELKDYEIAEDENFEVKSDSWEKDIDELIKEGICAE